MQKIISCAIVGAGSIGGLIDTPQSSQIASHAHAILKHPNCRLLAIVEPNVANQIEFMKRWGNVAVYDSLDALFQNETIELLVIASPTPFHTQALEKTLHVKGIRYILCEKPLVHTLSELETLKTSFFESTQRILVHLMRRFDPTLIRLAEHIAQGKLGKATRFQGVFNKGLLHNGIHMLALLEHLLGEIQSIQPLHVKLLENDISGDFALTLKNAQGVLSCLDSSYSAFELSIWFENGKVEIKEGGAKIELFAKKPSAIYEGYFSLEHEESLPNSLQNYALNSLEFLLQNDDKQCKEILRKHIALHEKIFETIEKEKLQ